MIHLKTMIQLLLKKYNFFPSNAKSSRNATSWNLHKVRKILAKTPDNKANHIWFYNKNFKPTLCELNL